MSDSESSDQGVLRPRDAGSDVDDDDYGDGGARYERGNKHQHSQSVFDSPSRSDSGRKKASSNEYQRGGGNNRLSQSRRGRGIGGNDRRSRSPQQQQPPRGGLYEPADDGVRGRGRGFQPRKEDSHEDVDAPPHRDENGRSHENSYGGYNDHDDRWHRGDDRDREDDRYAVNDRRDGGGADLDNDEWRHDRFVDERPSRGGGWRGRGARRGRGRGDRRGRGDGDRRDHERRSVPRDDRRGNDGPRMPPPKFSELHTSTHEPAAVSSRAPASPSAPERDRDRRRQRSPPPRDRNDRRGGGSRSGYDRYRRDRDRNDEDRYRDDMEESRNSRDDYNDRDFDDEENDEREREPRVRGRGRGFQKRGGPRLEPLPVWEVPRDNKYYLHDDRVAAAAAAVAARKAEREERRARKAENGDDYGDDENDRHRYAEDGGSGDERRRRLDSGDENPSSGDDYERRPKERPKISSIPAMDRFAEDERDRRSGDEDGDRAGDEDAGDSDGGGGMWKRDLFEETLRDPAPQSSRGRGRGRGRRGQRGRSRQQWQPREDRTRSAPRNDEDSGAAADADGDGPYSPRQRHAEQDGEGGGSGGDALQERPRSKRDRQQPKAVRGGKKGQRGSGRGGARTLQYRPKKSRSDEKSSTTPLDPSAASARPFVPATQAALEATYVAPALTSSSAPVTVPVQIAPMASNFDPSAAMAFGSFPVVAPMPANAMSPAMPAIGVPVGMLVGPQMQVPPLHMQVPPQAAGFPLPSTVTPPLSVPMTAHVPVVNGGVGGTPAPADFQPPARESRALPITAPKKEKIVEKSPAKPKGGEKSMASASDVSSASSPPTSNDKTEQKPSASPAESRKSPTASSSVTKSPSAEPQKEPSDSRGANEQSDSNGANDVDVKSRQKRSDSESSEKSKKAASGGLKGLMSKFF